MREDIIEPPAEWPAPHDEAMQRRRAELGGGSLRRRVAQGTIVNSVYLVLINSLTIIQGLLVARLLGAAEYGIWGLLVIIFGTLAMLAGMGFDDKLIQQDHEDQEAAFQTAFTLQAILSTFFALVALAVVPLCALLYDEPRIVVPGILTALAMPLIAFDAPTWVFYRRMDFRRTRILESIRPVTTFMVTVPMAALGFGFWSLFIGSIMGVVARALATVFVSPYRLRFRLERSLVREYTSYSWPVITGSLIAVVTYQVPVTIAARAFGTAAVGAVALSANVLAYTRRVDDVVTHALYPAICAVKDQRDLLFESFSKSNRLAVLWGVPVGVAASLFAGDLVRLVLGGDWTLAVPLIHVLGISAALDQVGFNWTAFARARGDTRILAVQSGLISVAVLAVGVPLLVVYGLPGYAAGLAAGTVVSLAVRFFYLARLFPAFRLVNHVVGAVVPTVIAAFVVLLGRTMLPGQGGARALAEAAIYLSIVVVMTLATERALLNEAFGYLRRAVRTAPAG